MTAGWSVQGDQSSASNFKTSDLQIAKGTGATPTFAMAHRMGLVKLNPTTKSVSNKLTYTYNKSDGTYTSSTSGSATITASNDFTGNKPYNSSGYWHIVKATAASTNTAMAFTCNTNQKDFWSEKSSGTDVGYGKYKTIDIQSDRTAANFEALFSYVGTCQTIAIPWYGIYKLQCWGASGGQGGSNANNGHGAYVAGNITLTKRSFYVYVGQQGSGTDYTASWNGGGPKGNQTDDGSGGGATDIRTVKHTDSNGWSGSSSLSSRIIVAAGGGGSDDSPTTNRTLSYGGGLQAYSGYYANYDINIYGATQSRGGSTTFSTDVPYPGTFGMACQTAYNNGCGGGGGYYGGGNSNMIGQGGSSFISGHPGCTTISGYAFVSGTTTMIDGIGKSWTTSSQTTGETAVQMPTTSGGKEALNTGHSGHGYAKITSQ